MLKQLLIFGTLIALDAIYIGSQYKYLSKMYGGIQKSPLQINFVGAGLCYIALTFLLYYFILSKKGKILDAFLLGVGTYAVYEFTNYATFRNWPLYMVIVDTLWGGVIFALTSKIYYSIYV
uniref:DUF2177 family protein n=1 Tax=viral metagenome TaxID=1070528 RepID=A0A6C0D1W7_9ZZZZ